MAPTPEYPINLRLEGKPVLLVGGGEVAAGRLHALLDCGAQVTVVSPKLTPAMERLVSDGRFTRHARVVTESDIDGQTLILAATDDPQVNSDIARWARARGILVNVADDPPNLDFAIPSLFRRGDVLVTVSTTGSAPGYAGHLRRRLESQVDDADAQAVEILREERQRVRTLIPEMKQRFAAIKAVVALDLASIVREQGVEAARRAAHETLEAWIGNGTKTPAPEGEPPATRASTLRAFGVDHTTAPIGLREQLAIDRHRLGAALESLRGEGECREACIVSTCLRTEIYVVGGRDDLPAQIAHFSGVDPAALERSLLTLEGPEDAARRLFRVAAGLESLVVGESEILGQVKAAHQAAAGHGSTGPLLTALFERALAAGKRVRSQTAIASGAISMPSLAIRLAEEAIGSLNGRSVVVLGTGDMARVAATRLAERDAKLRIVSRRLIERAQELARETGAEACMFESDLSFAADADLLICATSASHAIVERDVLAKLLERRSGRALFIVDLAVPRDVEPGAANLPGCRLINVDDLEEMGATNRAARLQAVGEASALIEEHVADFVTWWASLEVAPTIAALQAHLERLRQEELSRLPAGEREAVDRTSRALIAKIAHGPIARLRREAERGDGQANAALLRAMFGLDGE